jgi:hypothetical protein
MMISELEKPKFTLLEIESALSELIIARAEAEATEDPAEREQALAAVDDALAEYVSREILKADSIIDFTRHLKRALEAAKEDRDYYARRASFLERTLNRVKEATQFAMELVGKKRIEGRHGYLTLRGNGGQQALTVDESLLPDEYRLVTVRVPLDAWKKWGVLDEAEVMGTCPNQRKIRGLLERGEGVPGAYLEPRGQHVEVR